MKITNWDKKDKYIDDHTGYIVDNSTAIKDLTKTFKDENFKFKTEYDIASANVASWYTSMSDTIDALEEKIEELIKEFTNLIVVANG